jgi:hypothetical protein
VKWWEMLFVTFRTSDVVTYWFPDKNGKGRHARSLFFNKIRIFFIMFLAFLG